MVFLMNCLKLILLSNLILVLCSSTGFSKTLQLQCEGFRNFSVNIEDDTCRIENQKWQLTEFNKKYLLCEVSDPQLTTFEINLMTNKAIYEDTDTDETYELLCYKKF